MDLSVVSLSQDVSFEDGSITNFVLLRVPSGQVIRAVVTDDSAKVLVETFAAQQGSTMNAPPTPTAPATTNDEGAVIFGGAPSEYEEPASSFWMPSVAASDPRPAPRQQPAPKDAAAQARAYKEEQQHIRNNPRSFEARTVAKDEYGYPIVRGNGVDPGEVLGGGDVDDDGVGSI